MSFNFYNRHAVFTGFNIIRQPFYVSLNLRVAKLTTHESLD